MKSPIRTEYCPIIQAAGEDCAACVDGAKSDSLSGQIDVCRAAGEAGVYFPIHMDINNQRPSWCPGFNKNGNGLAAETVTVQEHEQHQTEHQEELPL